MRFFFLLILFFPPASLRRKRRRVSHCCPVQYSLRSKPYIVPKSNQLRFHLILLLKNLVSVKAMLKGRFLAIQAYLKKQEKSQINNLTFSSVQFSSVAQSCPTLCNPMNRSTPAKESHSVVSDSLRPHGL